jgi:CHAT domain-containing protein/tetratricopeptide (TPR) repeat protein
MNDEHEELERIHGPYVAALEAAGDWAGLCRYWIAHQYLPALDRALAVTEQLGGKQGAELTRFLEAVRANPFRPLEHPPDVNPGDNTDAENATLDILLQYPFAALCQFATRLLPVAEQDAALRLGIQFTERILGLAHAAEDTPLVAFFLGILADGFWNAADPERAAAAAYREAKVSYRALAEKRPDAFRRVLAMILNNLGNALADLSDPEGAVAAYREAEAIYRALAEKQPDDFRPDLAMILSNLGASLRDLGDPEGAAAAHGEAETTYRVLAEKQPDDFRPDLASTLSNLGTALGDLGDPERATVAFREAEATYRALAEKQPDAFRPGLASTLSNLGNTLGDPERATLAFREAEAIYRALAEKRPGAFRPGLALTLQNLGTALGALGDSEGAAAAYREAEALYDEAAAWVPTAFLPDRVRMATSLGELLLTENPTLGWPDRQAAREALRKARRCAEQLRGRFKDRNQRRRVLAEALPAYRLLVEVCLDIGRIFNDPDAWREAAEVAEASRARALMELLAEQELAPANAPLELVAEFRRLRKDLRDAMLRLEMEEAQAARAVEEPRPKSKRAPRTDEERAGVRSPQLLHDYYETPSEQRRQFLVAEVERLERDHQAVLDRVRQHDPEFDPDQPVPPVTFAEMQALLPIDRPTAVVQYTLTPNRAAALVITPDGVDAVELPGLNAQRGIELANDWYTAYRRAFDTPGPGNAWANELPAKLEPMAKGAVWPVVERLRGRGVERLIFAPAGAMHLFPLHAAVLPDGTYLADHVEVGYTPSLSILARCRNRTRPTPTRMLSAVNPTLDLHYADPEGDFVRRYFAEVAEERGDHVDRLWVLTRAGDRDVLHYSGHSIFVPSEPLRSGLVLKSQRRPAEWLTLCDVYCGLHLREATLVVLSGCESGMILPDQVDDYVGLSLGFLYAGATCVLGSLWAVNDPVTMLTMDRFYAVWQGGRTGVTVGAALADTQRWLRGIATGAQLRAYVLHTDFLGRLGKEIDKMKCRVWADRLAKEYPDSPPFASPAYWAPFVASGLSYATPRRPQKSV